jgi:hypothetical protein
VEGNDRAVTYIVFHVVQYLFGTYTFTVIAGYEVPHDDAIVVAKRIVLPKIEAETIKIKYYMESNERKCILSI